MRSGHLILLMLLSFTPTAAAQTPTAIGAAEDLAASLGADPIVDRIMAFDASRDGRVARDELIERLQPLVDRGDRDGDGALDSDEIRALANDASVSTDPSQRFPSAARYTFADFLGESSSSHIENAVDDLRLAAGPRTLTIAIVEAFIDRHHADAAATLMADMEHLLTTTQMADFREVVNRQLRARVHGFHGSADARATFSHPNLTMIVTATDHERRIAVYPLSADNREKAESALMRYRARLRPGDAERSALLAQLADVLEDEERTDLWAALQRRPLVQETAPFGVSVAAVGIRSRPFVRLLDQLRQR